jgi:hypothetical protein
LNAIVSDLPLTGCGSPSNDCGSKFHVHFCENCYATSSATATAIRPEWMPNASRGHLCSVTAMLRCGSVHRSLSAISRCVRRALCVNRSETMPSSAIRRATEPRKSCESARC